MTSFLVAVDGKLGELVFENRSGLVGNVAGRLNIVISRLMSDVEKERSIGEEGFSELETDVDQQLVEEIHTEFETVLDEGVDSDSSDAQNESESRTDQLQIHNMEGENGETVVRRFPSSLNDYDAERFGEIQELFNELRGEIEGFYGSNVEPIYVNMMRYPERDEGDLFARSWHMDEYSPDHKRIFVLLTDAEKGKGSSCFLDREDSKEALKMSDSNFKRDSDFWQKFEHNHFYGEKGTLGIADPMDHYHRGTNPEGHRDILIITVRPSTNPPADDWLEGFDSATGTADMRLASSLFDTLKSLIGRA